MASTGSIIARDDTLLGVCFALGEDFGFDPFYLRILLGALVLWSLPTALGAYAALGALVGISRWIAPDPKPVEETVPEAPGCGREPCEELSLAA